MFVFRLRGELSLLYGKEKSRSRTCNITGFNLRVLFVVGHGGIYSGGSHQSLYALRGLKNAGIEVMAVWGHDVEGDPDGFRSLKDLDIPLELIPVNRPATWRSIRQLRKVLKEFKPDVVECVKGRAQHHILYSSFGLKRHAIVYYRGVSRPLDFFQAVKYRLPRVDRIIANCFALKENMVMSGSVNPDKIDVVYGEYDPACADPGKVDTDGLKTELGIPENAVLITQLGNWAVWRGQENTLEAAAELTRDGCNVHFLFVGQDTDKLRGKVESLGISAAVTLSPYRRDPERILKITDIIVNASTGVESLSGALLNAHAMAVPAVATAVSGSVEIVGEGVTGFIVPPHDIGALAKAIRKLLDMSVDQRRHFGQNARKRAGELFSPAARVEKRLESYAKAIHHRKGE